VTFDRRDFLKHVTAGAIAVAAADRPLLSDAATALVPARVRRYEYVFVDGNLYVYDLGGGFALARHVPLPMTSRGIKGACASAATGMLYVSYGGDGGSNGRGSMLKYDLRTNRVLWAREYAFGIDSMAIDPAGRRIYMPSGEASAEGWWYVVEARDGSVAGRIAGAPAAHNTIVSADGRRVYLGAIGSRYLLVASTRTSRVFRRIGPLVGGVRPFTVNGRETLAFTTASGYLGFQVSSVVTGRVLHTVAFPGFGWDPATFGPSCPSHGISLAPEERELYVLDAPNARVHVFDVRRLPRRPPEMVASIEVHSLRGTNHPCRYDCGKIGWINHTRDGRFVFVAEAGDVIDTRRRRVVRTLEMLANTRKHIEIHFDDRGRVAWAARSRSSVGYVR
jgi:DNA-binding beta-propeller fold protein YncE